MRSAHGVTLIELLTALTLLAILAAAAAPGFRHMARRAAVLSATHEIMSALHSTRAAAITRGQPGIVCVTGTTGTCLNVIDRPGDGYLAWLDTGADRGRLDPRDTVLFRSRLPGRISLRGSRTSVTFWPVSRAGTTNTLSICDRDAIAAPSQVIVSQSGRPRLATAPARACE